MAQVTPANCDWSVTPSKKRDWAFPSHGVPALIRPRSRPPWRQRRLWWVNPTTHLSFCPWSCQGCKQPLKKGFKSKRKMRWLQKHCHSYMRKIVSYSPTLWVIMICHKGTLKTATLPLTQKKTHQENIGFFNPSLDLLFNRRLEDSSFRDSQTPKHWVVSDYNLIGKTWLDLFTPVRVTCSLRTMLPVWTE